MLMRPFYELPPDKWLLRPDPSTETSVSQVVEFIRQWVVSELVSTYRYPHEWLGSRIILIDPDSTRGTAEDFRGLAVCTSSGHPFLWISVGEPGDADSAHEILREALLSDPYCGTGLSTDGSAGGTTAVKRRFDTEECDVVNDLEMYASAGLVPTPRPYRASSDATLLFDNQQRILTPLTERFENILFEAHSHIRDIDGMHADESLDEVCKLLHTKLYDEETTKTSGPYRMQRWVYGTTGELATSVRSLYEEANFRSIEAFRLDDPGFGRSRGIFDSKIRLSDPALAKVVETLQEYDLTNSDIDVKGRAFQRVLSPAIRSGMGQYFTPDEVVNFIVHVVRPKVSELVLDPFCGSARFLTAALHLVRMPHLGIPNHEVQEFASGRLHGIEKSDRMVRIGMTDLRLKGDGRSNIRCTDALLPFLNYRDLQSGTFDVVMTNPPFGSILSTDVVVGLGPFNLSGSRKNLPLEVLGLERCIQFLKPGGRLAIVLPDGILDNPSMRYVREWAERHVKLRAIVSLPIETFAPYGANVKTSILFARKWEAGEYDNQDYPVFMARIENVGYDASGRIEESLDCEHVVDQFGKFIELEGW